MTERGDYLKRQMERKKLSKRGLAKLLAEARAGEPLEAEDKRVSICRRTVSRYFSMKAEPNDVSDDMVKELSPLLKVSVKSWPAKRPSKMRRMEAELARLRGEIAAETQRDGAPALQAGENGGP